jgi:hypothetical protein
MIIDRSDYNVTMRSFETVDFLTITKRGKIKMLILSIFP